MVLFLLAYRSNNRDNCSIERTSYLKKKENKEKKKDEIEQNMVWKWEKKTIRKTDNHDSGLEPKTNVKKSDYLFVFSLIQSCSLQCNSVWFYKKTTTNYK